MRRRGASGDSDGMFRVLRNPSFSLFWSAAIVSNTGGWLTQLAVPFVLFQLTGSAVWVGLVSVAGLLPGILVGPLAGSISDRFDRRRVLLVTQSAMGLAALALWAIWEAGVREPVILLIPLVVTGVFQSLNMPSWQSFVNDLVERDELRAAVTLNSLQFNIARSLGPALAGGILAVFGPGLAFGLNAAAFVIVLLALLLLRARRPQVRGRATGGALRQFGEALRYTRGKPGLVVAIIVTLMVGIFGNAIFTLTVVFAELVYQVDEVGLGFMNAALGLGAVLAVPIMSLFGNRLPLSRVVTWALLGYGLFMIALGVFPGYVAGLVCLVLIGACFLAVTSSVNTALQLIVTDGMRGRVIAVRMMLYTGAIPIGTMLQSALTDWLGAPLAIIIAGIGMLIGAIVLMGWPGGNILRRLDDPHDESDD